MSESERARQLKFFESHLRVVLNKQGRPYKRRAIDTLVSTAAGLNKYLNDKNYDGGLDTIGVGIMNEYLRWYYDGHSQGGANTVQRHLQVLFNWLAEEFESPHPFRDPKFQRYQPASSKPPVLKPGVITDMLKVTTGKSYLEVRDQAIIRTLMSGMRREECAQLHVENIDFNSKVFWVIGLKSHETVDKRPVPFGNKTALALNRWLRVRETNKRAGHPDKGALWLGDKNRGQMTGNGIYQMICRRARETGHTVDTKVYPHLFRHTLAHEHLADGGSEGDLMGIMGWSSRIMVDRYGASEALNRAITDSHKRGLDDRY